MWYEVSKEDPAPYSKPKAIFPWEERETSRPTRVFAEDLKSPVSEKIPTLHTSSGGTSANTAMSPATPTIKVTDGDAAKDFSGLSKNAWDEVSGIDNYVRQLTHSQRLRGQLQVLSHQDQQPQSPEVERTQDRERRESLILTDFPSAIERPSLPVTPAPIRRPSFWGEERDSEGHLPQAEGVPDQADWVCLDLRDKETPRL